MDELALRTTHFKTQLVKLKHTQNEIDDLKSERAGIKCCVSDVNSLLSNLLEPHDPILTITIRRHLADKLRPVIALLNKIEGVPKVPALPEQGGSVNKSRDETNGHQ